MRRALGKSSILAAVVLAACPELGTIEQPPVAVAGLDQVAAPETTVTLDGTGSYDPDGGEGEPLSYAWLPISIPEGSTAALQGPDTASPTMTVDRVGAYIFRLVVTDVDGNPSVPDAMVVTVNPYLEVSVVPADGADTVAVDATVVAVFSAPVQAETANVQTIQLSTGGSLVDVAISLDDGNTVAVVTPAAPLTPATRYDLAITPAVRTLRGFSLAAPFASTFTTLAGADTTPPAVVAVVPGHGAQDVARSSSVTVTFSEPVEPASVTATTFVLSDGTTAIASTIDASAGNLRATLTPNTPLTGGITYTVTVGASVQDLAGNPMAAPFASSFSTSAQDDVSPPSIVAVDPADGFTDVAIQSVVMVTFSEPVDPATVTDATLTLSDAGGTPVSGSIDLSVGNTVATLTPAIPLAYERTYHLAVTASVTDWDGNPLSPPFASSFSSKAEARDLDRFEVVAAPVLMTVGETTTVTIIAKRVDGITNVVYNNVLPVLLSHTGDPAGVTWAGNGLTDHGDGTAELAASTFVNGVATVTLTNTVPEGPVSVTVVEQDTGLGRSGTTTASGTDMTWEIGGLDRFLVVASPTSLVAGSAVNITMTAVDEYGNTILEYSNAAGLELTHTGTAATTSWHGGDIFDNGDGTATVEPAAFFGGVALARLLNDAAEGPVTITVTDPGGGATGSTAASGTDVTWTSGGLVGFVVTAKPSTLTAGELTTITIEARDIGGNTITDYQNSLDITLRHDGMATDAQTRWAGTGVTDNADATGSLAAGSFSSGIATVTLANDLAEGPVVITVTESDTGQSRSGSTVGTATNVTWTPGPVDHFSVRAFPTQPQTGSSTAVTITAEDSLGNTARSYQNAAPIDLTQSGGTGATMSWGGAGVTDLGGGSAILDTNNRFSNGVATVLVSNTAAEGPVDLVATAAAVSGSTASTTTSVTWVTGGIFAFEASAAPTDPTAGDATTVTITAKDSGGNTIATYQNTVAITLDHSGAAAAAETTWAGAGVTDNADGTGSLDGGGFSAGVATVTLANTVAEGPVVIAVTENDTGQSRSGNTVATGTSVTWGPAALHHLEVAAFPTTPQTSSSTTVSITAKDAFANTMRSYQNTLPLSLAQAGGTAATITWGGAGVTDHADGTGTLDTASRFANGRVAVLVSNTTAEGPVNLMVGDGTVSGDTAATGSSPTWVTGGIFSFEVMASPIDVVAGSSTSVTITAKDSGGNTIAGYQNTLPILLEHSGGAPPPAVTWAGIGVVDNIDGTGSLAGGSFASGIATVTIANTMAEGPVILTVTEQDSGSGRTGNTNLIGANVTWSPSAVDHFELTAFPTSPQTGSSSTVTVTAKDGYGNTVLDYQNLAPIDLTQNGGTATTITWGGSGVTDNGDGSGTLDTGSRFSGGVASVLVSNTTAEGPVVLAAAVGLVSGDTSATGTDVTWQTGGISSFEVTAAPTSRAAGERTNVTITAKDSGGNTITDYQNTLAILLRHSGSAPAASVDWGGTGVTNAGDGTGRLDGVNPFVAGVATVTLANDVAEGPVILTVTEKDTGSDRSGNTNLTGTNVTWLPGGIDHFTVAAFPTRPETGSSSTVSITAKDFYDNTIPTYSNTADIDLTQSGGTAATISWGGTGVSTPAPGAGALAAGQFTNGVASALVSNTTAEGPVNLIVTENDVPGITGSTAVSGTSPTWQTGGIFSFEVAAAPTTQVAGSPVTMTIVAKDVGGNTIETYQNTLDLLLEQNGGAPVADIDWGGTGVTNVGDGSGRLDGASRFVAGVATVTLADNVAEGPVIITATEQDTGLGRTGNTVATGTNATWTPGLIDYFDVAASPASPDATQSSTITITARDFYDNLVSGYANTNPIALDQNGSANGKIWGGNACLGIPGSSNASGDNTLGAGCWSSGQTTLTLRSSVAEGPIIVTVTENDTPGAFGTSPGITWTPAAIDHFYLVSDFTTRAAGEQVVITIEARDQFDNVISTYDNTMDITLDQTGAVTGKTWDGNACLGIARGSGAGGDNTLTTGCWVGGVTTLTLANTVAEPLVNVIVTENDTGLNRAGSLQIQGSQVTWSAGPLDHYDVAVSSTAETAGQEVTLTITAEDVFGNPLTGYDNTLAVTLDQNGSASGKVWDDNGCLVSPGGSDANGDNQLGAGCWTNGVTTMTLSSTVAEGPVVVTVTEKDSGSSASGLSAPITWSPGSLARFRVEAAPTGVQAGFTSDVTITAEDLYGNTITAYGNTAAIDLTQNAGTTGIAWAGLGGCASTVADLGDGSATLADCFVSGVAEVQVANLQAEGPVTIAVTENDTALFRTGNTAQTGTNVTWTPGPMDHFWVVGSPTSLAINSAASLTIQAEDGVNFPVVGRGNAIPGYATTNPIDVTPSCAPTCAGSITYTPVAWDNGDDTATVPASTLFDGLGQLTLNVTASVDTGGGVTFTATQQVSGETGNTGQSGTDIAWLAAGCPAPTSVPEVIGGSSVADCTVDLTGVNSDPPPPETITVYAWSFISVPSGSAVTDADLSPSASDPNPTFVADVPGNYVLELAVTNSCGNNNNKSLLVEYVPGPASPGDVLITEVVIDPRFDWDDQNGGNGVPYDPVPGPAGDQSRSNDQWVEIYNAATCPIDLSDTGNNPDGWYLFMTDNGTTEARQLGSSPADTYFSPGSSLTTFRPGDYMIIGDPALNWWGGSGALEVETYLQLWSGLVGSGTLIDDVELDPPGGEDPEGDVDGDGAPSGESWNINSESVYRHNTPPYADTDNDQSDWATSTTGSTIAADNPS